RAVYFAPNGSSRFHTRPPRVWFVELDALKAPFEFDPDELSNRVLLGYAQQKMLRGRIGEVWSDESRGGEVISHEEAAVLRGLNAEGVPCGLSRCDKCREYRGHCLDPMHPDDLWLLPVYCRCENMNHCARCGELLHERR